MTEASPAVGEFVKMSKGQTLLSLVKERLALAAEDIFVLFERTIAEYEEELCRSKEENQRKQQLLDQLHRPTIQEVGEKVQTPSSSPGHGLNQEIQETVQIKEEPEEQSVKQEEEQLPEPVPESSAVCVKTEEFSLLQQRQTEHREETQGGDISSETHFHSEAETGHTELSPHTDNDQYWEPPFSCSTAQMEIEAEGEPYNQVQTRDRSSKLYLQHYSTPETSVHRGDMSGAEGQEGMKFQCPFCQRKFGKKQDLERHVRVHTGEKPYTCSHCNQHFAHAFALSRHRRIHTGEKPYSCPVCKRTFANKHHLEKHKRSHTGEKPFSCSTCEKTFADKHVLNLHERTHTGDKPFSCSTCEKTFAHKRALYLHNRSHTGKNKKTLALKGHLDQVSATFFLKRVILARFKPD